jgi:hypothetical protein
MVNNKTKKDWAKHMGKMKGYYSDENHFGF